eukprot:EG_transcript_3920
MASPCISLTSYTEFPAVQASVRQKLLVMAHLKAPEMNLPAGKERPPISVSAVIDRSGSMTGGKLALTKAALRFVVANLTANDEFGLVTYSSDVKEALQLQRMTPAGRVRALSAVDDIQAGGCTHLSGGLFAGIDQVRGLPVQEGRPPNDATQSRVALLIGNECDPVARRPASARAVRAATAPWALFVRLADGIPGVVEDYVASVDFELPVDGGTMRRLTVPYAPFQLSRVGHSNEPLRVFVTLAAAHGSATHTFEYTPNFGSSVTYTTVLVPLPGGNSSPPSSLRATTTPPSPILGLREKPQPAHRYEVSAVWLFTDGLANRGLRHRDQLVPATKARLEGMNPACNVFTFGFGLDHDAQLLKDVADAGHGMYYFVEDEGAIAWAFADCLGGLMSVMAKGITLTATPAAGVTVHRVCTKFDHGWSPMLAWVKIADLYSEEERDVILEIEVPVVDPPAPTPLTVLQWRLEYHNLLSDEVDTAEETCLLARPVLARPSPPHPLLDQQRNRLRCADAIEEAKRLADEHRLPDARALLQQAAADIAASATGQGEYCRGLVEDLRECLASMDNMAQYESLGTKVMLSNAHSHGKQRSSRVKTRYANSSKAAMVRKFAAKS